MIEIDNKRSLFRRGRTNSNPYRILLLLFLIIGAFYFWLGYEREEIVSPFAPTPTATRLPSSFVLEAETQFKAGNLNAAIVAYKEAAALEPNNAGLIAELARIQTYYSGLSNTDAVAKERLNAAKISIDKATEIDPKSSFVQAIRAFVYNWNANPTHAGENAGSYMAQAEQAAMTALQLDSQNALALAYYAEILIDNLKYEQAFQNIRQALERDSTLMDVHRVAGYVRESSGDYEGAIEEYKKAVEIAPNFTPLYIQIGTNYRTLGLRSTNDIRQKQMYEEALRYYEMAVNINKRIGVEDPIPYLAISRTYSQMGEFFVAALNVRTALDMRPGDPDIYGQLGLVYFRSRNYESAIPALKCSVYGCTAAESCEVRRCNEEVDPPIEITGLPLTDGSVIYYYSYGSVLAGMHRTGLDYCERSAEVLADVRAAFGNDNEIMAIIIPSEEICKSFNISGQ
ncbi:MAG: tetratricopeptide repeat protein [Bellilinea sp.]